MECKCESCARKDCNERTKQDDLRLVIQCADFVKKNMTNGDKIRGMTDEELAEFLSKISVVATRMSSQPYMTLTQQAAMHEHEYLYWRRYLCQPVEDELWKD